MEKRIAAEHGIISRLPECRFGYFGWPSVALMDNGTLVAVSSGMRSGHVDPWGRTTFQISEDLGRTWSEVRVINDSPIDDRDAGVVALGGSKLLVSWFTSDTRAIFPDPPQQMQESLKYWSDELVDKFLGSYVMLSEDNGWTWGAPVRVPITSPHGPTVLDDGSLLYLGKEMFGKQSELHIGEITAYRSTDSGRTWSKLGSVPAKVELPSECYCEPHAIQLPSGKLLGVIRLEGKPSQDLGLDFTMMITSSEDQGVTWAECTALGFHGSPGHLLRHSSGTIILSYGYRREPFGERVAFSRDEGVTWEHDWIIREDGPTGDLGYPAAVELPDGSIYSVYYQQYADNEPCSLLSSRWRLPE